MQHFFFFLIETAPCSVFFSFLFFLFFYFNTYTLLNIWSLADTASSKSQYVKAYAPATCPGRRKMRWNIRFPVNREQCVGRSKNTRAPPSFGFALSSNCNLCQLDWNQPRSPGWPPKSTALSSGPKPVGAPRAAKARVPPWRSL